MTALGQIPREPHGVRLEVRNAVDRDLAVLVLEQHRSADVLPASAQVHAGRVRESRVEPQPGRGVVVAAGDDHGGPGRGQPRERVVGELDGVHGRQRPVVDVAGDHHEVDVLGLHDVEQVVDVRRLGTEHPDTVERASQVPVGGVEDAHARTLSRGTDRNGAHTPSRSAPE